MAKATFQWIVKPGSTHLSLQDALSWLEEAASSPAPLKNILHIANWCSKERYSTCGLRLYSYIQRNGLQKDCVLANQIVSMLVNVGSVETAKILFDQLSSKTGSSWDSLIKGYLKCGHLKKAFSLYHHMLKDSLLPTSHTCVALLQSCGKLRDIAMGNELHAHIANRGMLKADVFVGSALVDMYAKCGLLEKAHQVFEELPERDAAMWNALIAGYAKHECAKQALDCLAHMMLEGVTPNAITFTCILKACGKLEDIRYGEDIHNKIDKQGLLIGNPVLGSALVNMYAKCGFLEKARKVCEELSEPNLDAWNALITGYVQHNEGEKALHCFERVLGQNISPNGITYICTLNACSKNRALDKGQELHAQLDKRGWLKTDPVVGNALVDMYVKCGSLAKARKVFDELSVRTVISWNSLISGYVEHEYGAEAMECLEMMHSDGIDPNGVSLVFGLKACGITQDTNKGMEIHSEIARNGLLRKDLFIGGTLVDMYARCGSLAKAQETLFQLPHRNVVAWNALIAGYAKQECCFEALSCLEQMQGEGVSPDAITLTCCLKACANSEAINKGRELHAEIARRGLLERDDLLGSSLVDMYASCGSLSTAQEVFDGLPVRNLCAWNTLISGYAEHDYGEEVLYLFEQMKLKGPFPDVVTLICGLKACGIINDVYKGIDIHAEIERKGLTEENPVGCALVDMYNKCGLLERAHDVFDYLLVHYTGSWNALIAGYCNQEHAEKALDYFQRMRMEGAPADAITYACTLKACGNGGSLNRGFHLHTEIMTEASLETDFLVANALLDMYASCGALTNANKLFEKLPERGVVSWNAMIGGYVKHQEWEQALICLEHMEHEGVSPDAITFTCSLKACGMVESLDKAIDIHGEAERQQLLQRDLAVGNAVIDMYTKCSFLARAKDVFESLPRRDIISWNTLLAGYAQHNYGHESLACLEQMQLDGINPNAITFACSLKACGSIGAMDKGREIHAIVEREGLTEENNIVGNALVDVYAKCGFLIEAHYIFDNLPSKSAVSWNALIAGYVTHLHGEEALKCFEGMQQDGFLSSSVTFRCSLRACGIVAASDRGRIIHTEVERRCLLEEVGSAMVDMYAKCGLLEAAEEVFERLPCLDIVSWNALIGGYAQWGEAEVVFQSFDWMIEEGIGPDEITFGSVLNACSHAGLVDEAYKCFGGIIGGYGIIPVAMHYTCMVDLLGRVGQDDSAMALTTIVPVHPDITMWSAVLGACRKWSNVDLGQQAFDHVVGLDDREASPYVSMYNIYADADNYEHLG